MIARTCAHAESALKPGKLVIRSCSSPIYATGKLANVSKRHGGSVIVLSQKGAGERGTLVCRRGKITWKFLCCLCISISNRIFKVYDTKTVQYIAQNYRGSN